LVGIDSIRKLTTPGSEAVVREQERRRIEDRRREAREVKDVNEVKDVEEWAREGLT
jgi:hypothetical protein